MSTITREQAKDLRNAFQCWQQDYDPVEDKEQYDMFGLGVVAMDVLLASLEAEPIYQLVNDDWYDTDKDTYDAVVSSGARGRIVYPAPPAPESLTRPVHPIISREELDDETLDELIDFRRSTFEYHSQQGNKVQTIIHGVTLTAMLELRERRTAMLQGAAGNSPVILDGWVLVPKEPTPAMLNAAWVSHGIYHASAYRTMLAAAPQQEVK